MVFHAQFDDHDIRICLGDGWESRRICRFIVQLAKQRAVESTWSQHSHLPTGKTSGSKDLRNVWSIHDFLKFYDFTRCTMTTAYTKLHKRSVFSVSILSLAVSWTPAKRRRPIVGSRRVHQRHNGGGHATGGTPGGLSLMVHVPQHRCSSRESHVRCAEFSTHLAARLVKRWNNKTWGENEILDRINQHQKYDKPGKKTKTKKHAPGNYFIPHFSTTSLIRFWRHGHIEDTSGRYKRSPGWNGWILCSQ